MKKENIAEGNPLTIKNEIISETGKIIFNSGDKVKVKKIIIKEGFWGKRSGQWYPEEIIGFRLVGYRGEWPLSTFIETAF